MESLLLKHLNPIQRLATIQTDGPILILAGAGSGKTRVLTYKVAYLLLEKLVPAENILMVTFTNKAANEMKFRIDQILNQNNMKNSLLHPYAGTFHSLCARILRREGKYLNLLPNYLIYDDQDKKEAIKEALIQLDRDIHKYSTSAIAVTISQAKNELISSREYLNIARGYYQEFVAKVYLSYQNILRENNALDFDDLLFYTVELFRQNPDVSSYYQHLYRYILIDEYQDTNHAQYVITSILSKKWKNICVVGDASQSIYAWRGADYRNISKFKEDFPQLKVFHLEQNYRSTQNILDCAYAVISKNNSHPILKLWTNKSCGESIVVYQAKNEQDEANYIINQIMNLKYNIKNHQGISIDKQNNSKIKFSDVAILYRTNAQSRVIEEAFLHVGMPYILVGGLRFYERKEIKDILAYLRLLVNPLDKISSKRVIKLGKIKYKNFLEFSNNYYLNSKKQILSTIELLDMIMDITKYLDRFNLENEDDLQRIENIKELRSVATEYPQLDIFLNNVSLVELEYTADHPKNDLTEREAVTLMTMHAAKGLEFNTVFMVGMEEGLFPHSRSMYEPLELEEERRLCYVGMTRAMDKLFLTYASKRLFFGQRNTNDVSRFISEIPSDLFQLFIA